MLSLATKTSLGPLNFENNDDKAATNLSDGTASSWVGIVLQAVKMISYMLSLIVMYD